jgi:phage shock protein E
LGGKKIPNVKVFVLTLLMAAMAFMLSACQTQPAAQPAATETAVPSAAEIPASPETAAAPAATDTAPAAEYRKITAAQAKARMDSGDPVIILDVRRQDEFSSGHIAGAVLLPNETIGTEKPAMLPDTGAEILIYCRSGNRSRQAAEKLAAMGYTNVWDFGGIIDWTYSTVTN